MLPLGHIGIRSVDGGASDRYTRFTKDEQVTMMTLWSIFRSPLMFGGELRDNDDWTLSLLTNEELLEMHRSSHGARQLYRKDDKVVWTAKGNDGDVYVALFNISDDKQTVKVDFNQLDLPSSEFQLKDVWKQEQVDAVSEDISYELSPHACVLLKVTGN